MNLFAPVSVYQHVRDHRGRQMPLAEFMQLGKTYLPQITAYRTLKATMAEKADVCEALDPELSHAKQVADEMKKRLPAATLSGYFAPTRAKGNLAQHSGFICIDIDDHYNVTGPDGVQRSYDQPLDDVRDILLQLPYVLYAGNSVGGKGFFAIIPLAYLPYDGIIPTVTAEDGTTQYNETLNKQITNMHEWYFDCLEHEFSQYGIVIDAACRDTSRLRIISYTEPDVAIRRKMSEVTPYQGVAGFVSRKERNRIHAEEQQRAAMQMRYAERSISDPDADYRNVSVCVDQVLRQGLSIADSYDDWKNLGIAFASAFGERGRDLFNAISSTSRKFSINQNNKDYDSFLKHQSGKSGIGTILYYFSKAGVHFAH